MNSLANSLAAPSVGGAPLGARTGLPTASPSFLGRAVPLASGAGIRVRSAAPRSLAVSAALEGPAAGDGLASQVAAASDNLGQAALQSAGGLMSALQGLQEQVSQPGGPSLPSWAIGLAALPDELADASSFGDLGAKLSGMFDYFFNLKLGGVEPAVYLTQLQSDLGVSPDADLTATLSAAIARAVNMDGAAFPSLPSLDLQALREGINAESVAAAAEKAFDALSTYGQMTPQEALAALVAQLEAASQAAGQMDPSTLAGYVAAGLALLLIIGRLGGGGKGKELSKRYDPEGAEDYFSKRPLVVARRLATMLGRSSSFAFNLFLDSRTGSIKKNQPKRAQELSDLLTFLGPTFIKIGQAISIRGDLLPPAYIEGLRQLQDSLPPFPTDEARAVIESELGLAGKGGIDSVFETLSPAPIAAASLGQVYKGRLRDGREVAVKVQRPENLDKISLDLMLVRWLAPRIRDAAGLNSDLVGLVDEWGTRFLEELDYEEEGRNAQAFVVAMERVGIETVTAPEVFMEYTARKVLTTAWVDGQRLDESQAEDVPRLCAVALNAYLAMLLDTGVLHADPHPGNLLRTPEGRLCILDWGLVTRIAPSRQEAILRYVGHLTSEQYNKVAGDLVAMGFIPADKERLVTETPYVTEVLGKTLAAIAKGGGVDNVKSNVELIGDELRDVGDKYGNIFQVPPYFAYILRTFSILEGIALMQDPSYTIVKECYPYIARRIFTDDSEVSREVLESLLFVGQGEERQLNVTRLERLLTAFQSFEENAADPEVTLSYDESSGKLDEGTKEALRVLLTPNGTYLQTLLLDEVARSVDVLSRDALTQLARMVMSSQPLGAATVASFTLQRQAAEALGPLRPFLLPLPLPFEIVESATPVVELSASDQATLETLERLWELVTPRVEELQAKSRAQGNTSPWGVFEQGARAASEVPEVVPGLQSLAEGLAQRLVERLAARVTGMSANLPATFRQR